MRERNILATQRIEHKRIEAGYGDFEADERDEEVRKTMRGIKHVLTERQYAWEDAVKLARDDPEVNLSGNGPAYTPVYTEVRKI